MYYLNKEIDRGMGRSGCSGVGVFLLAPCCARGPPHILCILSLVFSLSLLQGTLLSGFCVVGTVLSIGEAKINETMWVWARLCFIFLWLIPVWNWVQGLASFYLTSVGRQTREAPEGCSPWEAAMLPLGRLLLSLSEAERVVSQKASIWGCCFISTMKVQ